MKNKFKELVLPIGAVALATLPFVGIISCSNNKNENNSSKINKCEAFYNPNTKNVEIKVNGQNLSNDINDYVIKIDSSISNNWTIINHTSEHIKLVSTFNDSLVGRQLSISFKGNNNEIFTTYPSTDKISEKEMLNFEIPIKEISSSKWTQVINYRNLPDGLSLVNRSTYALIKEKVREYEPKWFNDDGTPIKYEVKVNIDPGMLLTWRSNTDTNKKYDNVRWIEYYDNMWKPLGGDNKTYNVWKEIRQGLTATFTFWMEYRKSPRYSVWQNYFVYDNGYGEEAHQWDGIDGREDLYLEIPFAFDSNIIMDSNAFGLKIWAYSTTYGYDNWLQFGWFDLNESQKKQIKYTKITEDDLNSNHVDSSSHYIYTEENGTKYRKVLDVFLNEEIYVKNLSGTISIKPIKS